MFDPIAALRVLRDHHVRFIVIGGYAAGILGAPVMTSDLDVCYDRSADNLERLAEALRAVDAKLRVALVDEDLPFLLDARTLAAGDSFTFATSLGDLDVLATPSGTGGYRDLVAGASSFDLGGGLVVSVVSLDDLIRMKEASARSKDELHLHELVVLKEMRNEADRPPSQ